MKTSEFVNYTVNKINNELFEELKSVLMDKYVRFSIIKNKDVTQELISEKVCDYIEKLTLKTDKKFYKHLTNSLDDISSMISNYLIDGSRASKYYSLALQRIDDKALNVEDVSDYMRIMICLYSEIIKNKHKDISNFNYSFGDIDLNSILDSMKTEEKNKLDIMIVQLGSEKRFNLHERYSQDSFTFMLVTIMYYYLKNNELKGE